MNPGRRILERLSRGRVFKRRLPANLGGCPILVSPDASLRYWKARIESDLFDYAREFVQPGSIVWDIGSNVGLFAIAAAQRAGQAGKVVAVEADIWLAGLLNKSGLMQPGTSAPIQVVPAAASSSVGISTFNIARRGRASNFLAEAEGASQAGGVRHTCHVVTITLDWLLERGPAPNVVKIDVEGAELEVLRGGLRVLAEAKPVILCEVNDYESEIGDLLTSHDYELYDWDSHPPTQISIPCYNTLALPLNPRKGGGADPPPVRLVKD